ncbi:MAG TPA: PAS domain S-box protein [Abditibacteriaceae bacterium]|jgi:PAS domain S-box-containing protein
MPLDVVSETPRSLLLQLEAAVSLRAQMEEALRESEEHYRALVNQNISGIIKIDFSGRVLFSNERFHNALGYTCEELLTMNISDFVYPQDIAESVTLLERMKENGQPFEHEKRFVRKDGSTFWVYNSISLISGADGRPEAAAVVSIDVTGRKVAEQELLQRENLALLLADVSAALIQNDSLSGVLRSSTEALVKHLDAAFARIWLLNPEKTILELKASSGLYTHLDGEHSRVPVGELKIGLIAAQRRPIMTNSIIDDERIKDPQWARREGLVAFAGFPLLVEDRLVGVMAMFARQPFPAITLTSLASASSIANTLALGIERKQVESDLLQSEERFRLLVENSQGYAMFLMDAGRRIIHWNTGAERIFGYTKAEAIGQHADMIFTPEDRAENAPQKEAETAVTEGCSKDIRWHLRRDGSRFWADGIVSRLDDADGGLRGFAKIARDATKEKEFGEALQQAHDTLEMRVEERTAALRLEAERRQRVEQEREQLLQRVVTSQEEERTRISRELHDQMSQQLTGLLLGLSALSTQAEANSSAVSFNQKLKEVQELASNVMQQMHTLAWELRPAALDSFGLEPALRRYVEEWEKSNKVLVDIIVNGLTETSRPSSNIETTLYRVVQEALTNVQRHAKAQCVSVLLDRQGHDVLLVIEDDGCGFEVDKKEDGSPAPVGQRLGLLGMVERLELVKGTLTIESKVGGGTTVFARIPWERRAEPRN